MGSDESHFNVSVGSDGQSHKTVSTNHNLRPSALYPRSPNSFHRRLSADRILGLVVCAGLQMALAPLILGKVTVLSRPGLLSLVFLRPGPLSPSGQLCCRLARLELRDATRALREARLGYLFVSRLGLAVRLQAGKRDSGSIPLRLS